MPPLYAVIDLGTNTFHLLIAAVHPDGRWQMLHRKRVYVRLGRSGPDLIPPTALAKALRACHSFRKRLDTYPVAQLRVVGTAALRTACNAPALMDEIARVLDCPVTLLSGEEEARLIALGVSRLLPDDADPALVMDIGGGSVEYILMYGRRMHWRQSFDVGIARLRHRFHHQEPMGPAEQGALMQYLDQTLAPLLASAGQENCLKLIGAAGIYEVLARGKYGERGHYLRPLDAAQLADFTSEVLRLNLEERLAHPAIPAQRAELFPVAMLLVHWVRLRLPVSEIWSSPYALKEGVLQDMWMAKP